MPELLFGIVPNTPEPPKYAFKSAPQTPSPLSDMTNTEKNSNQFTPRTTQSEDDSMTPEVEDLVRAPCKLSQSPEESHKPVKLSRRQLKFEDGVTLQSIVQASKEDKIVEVFESNPFCEKKENNFVPLKPQRNRGGVGRGGVKSRKRMEKQDSTAAVTVTGNTEENFCQITPQKKNMPHLFGNNVTLDSPDPMSKFNSDNHASSDLQQVAQRNTRISVLLQNCKHDVEKTQPSTNSVPRLDIKAVESLMTIRNEASKYVANKYEGVNVSPDAVTEDIYDFEPKTDQRTNKLNKAAAVESCKYPMSKDSFSLERAPPLQKLSDDEEFQLTSRVHAVRHKSVRIVEKQMTRRSLSPSLNTLERQLQNSAPSGGQQMLPTSRSLDTLHVQSHTPNTMEEGQYLVLKPTPPMKGTGSIRNTSFNRKSPQPPSTLSPKLAAQSSNQSNMTPPGHDNDKENIGANIRQARGRRYMNPVSPVVEETQEDITSPPLATSQQQRPLPSRPNSNAYRRRPQPSSISPSTHSNNTVQVEYCIKSPERRSKPTHSNQNNNGHGQHSPAHAADIPHPSPKRRKGDKKTVTVSGFSKQFLVALITAASKKRRRRNKHQPTFSVKLEQIPEDDHVVLTFPAWIPTASRVHVSSHIQLGPLLNKDHKEVLKEKSPERLAAEEEYGVWLRSQVVVSHDEQDCDDDMHANKTLDALMCAIKSQDNEQFKSLLNRNKNVIFARDKNGNTALVAATMFGWKRGIKNLIKRGADLDAQNRFGNTSLHYASAIPEHDEIRRYLLRKQASASIRNERGICSCDSILSC